MSNILDRDHQYCTVYLISVYQSLVTNMDRKCSVATIDAMLISALFQIGWMWRNCIQRASRLSRTNVTTNHPIFVPFIHTSCFKVYSIRPPPSPVFDPSIEQHPPNHPHPTNSLSPYWTSVSTRHFEKRRQRKSPKRAAKEKPKPKPPFPL